MYILRILLSLIYPILFIIPITLSGLCYTQTKRKECLIAGLLFFVFIMDHMVILLTELVPSFAALYDSTFLSVPTWKTMIYVVSIGCMIYLYEYNIKAGKVFSEAILLFLFTFFQMFVPMMPDGAMKVWVYYFPPQLYMFIFSLSALLYMKKRFPKTDGEEKTISYIRTIMYCTLIFSIAIVAEDSFVIFNVDNYSSSSTYIYNRNNCEDIFRVILGIFSSMIMLNALKDNRSDAASIETDSSEVPELQFQNIEIQDSGEAIKELAEEEKTAAESDNDQTAEPMDKDKLAKFLMFSQKYQLTDRERRIFHLILKNKSNQEISDELMISLGTVKTHTHNIFSKLDVSRRSEALRLYNSFEER